MTVGQMTSLFDNLPVMPRPPRAVHMETENVREDTVSVHKPFVIVIVDGKPEPKGRPRIGRLGDGRPVAFTPAHTRKYENYVKLLAGQAMKGRPPIDQPCGVRVRAFIPVPASWSQRKQASALYGDILPTVKPDGDNYLKIALDSLNAIVYRDDSLVTHMYVSKAYSDRPRLEIEVYV